MSLTIDHTLGDNDPMIVRLIRDGAPAPIDGATSIKLTVTPVNRQTPKYIDAQNCLEQPLLGVGVIRYNWQVADHSIPKGIKEAKVTVVRNSETKTYPTASDFDFLINFLPGA